MNKTMKSTKELLTSKRSGGEWSDEEIRQFVRGVVSGEVSSSQAAAFLMAACIRGLTGKETAALTRAMAESGDAIPHRSVSRTIVDKHSTGGVGDKVSLLLAPLAHACALAVPMISGRGLGHTGGTIDKLESIVGFRTNLTIDEMTSMLKSHGLFMAAQNERVAPADKILYALRDVTGTVENTGLITASILSKKLAEGLDALVMDVKVGTCAFMQTLEEARELATSLKTVGHHAHLPVTVVFTRMDHVLGWCVGNWLEVREAEQALYDRGLCHPELAEVTITLVAEMLVSAGYSLENATKHVQHVWDSGEAHKEFHTMITNQGGSWEQTLFMRSNDVQCRITAPHDGVYNGIDARALANEVIRCGGGRLVETDVIEPGVGVEFHVNLGDAVHRGTLIATAYAESESVATQLQSFVAEHLQIQKAHFTKEPSMILDVWRAGE